MGQTRRVLNDKNVIQQIHKNILEMRILTDEYIKVLEKDRDEAFFKVPAVMHIVSDMTYDNLLALTKAPAEAGFQRNPRHVFAFTMDHQRWSLHYQKMGVFKSELFNKLIEVTKADDIICDWELEKTDFDAKLAALTAHFDKPEVNAAINAVRKMHAVTSSDASSASPLVTNGALYLAQMKSKIAAISKIYNSITLPQTIDEANRFCLEAAIAECINFDTYLGELPNHGFLIKKRNEVQAWKTAAEKLLKQDNVTTLNLEGYERLVKGNVARENILTEPPKGFFGYFSAGDQRSANFIAKIHSLCAVRRYQVAVLTPKVDLREENTNNHRARA